MIEIIRAPSETTSEGIKLFIAGGIRNCPQWQNLLIEKLQNEEEIKEEIGDSDIKIIIFNPRCNDIPEEEAQVKWEYNKLKQSDIISFWFSEGSVNPITLFEYGSHIDTTNLIVGCHENYERKSNVIIQTSLARPDLKVNENFEDFYKEIVETLIDKITNYRVRNFNKKIK
jgi:hypothetical protein